MAGLERVQPGDLITSALFNAIIDRLASVESKVAACKDILDQLPAQPPPLTDDGTRPPVTPPDDGGRRPAMVIERIEPFDASPRDIVTITGRGFPSDLRTPVLIGGKAATVKSATATAIDVEVPTLGFKKRSEVEVTIGNPDDPKSESVRGKMTVGPPPEEIKRRVALRGVEGKLGEQGELIATMYTLKFTLGSTLKENLLVAVTSVDLKKGTSTPLSSTELSFAGGKKTQDMWVKFTLVKTGAAIKVRMLKRDDKKKEDEEVASQSYEFKVNDAPPAIESDDIFGAKPRG